MEQIDQDDTLPGEAMPALIDRDGNATTGVGRLDQIIGVTAAGAFFEEKAARQKFLHTRAVARWAGTGRAYRNRHTSKR